MKKMFFTGGLAVALASLVIAIGATAEPPAKAPPVPVAKTEARQLTTQAKTWTGDFDVMVERRVIRVLAPYSRSLYFNDKGRERGLAADSVRGFEQWINKKYAKQLGKRPITVLILPATRDKLLPEVSQGRGDIAVGNLTITEERRKIVDFVFLPDQTSVKELVITGPKSPAIATADDLAGKTVHVRKASSYHESLVALNGRFAKGGRPAVKIVLVPDALEDEDMLEMLNAGLLEAIVVDDWKAKMWAQVLPKIKVNEQAAVREGGQIGWAVRKGSPKLEAEILAYMKAGLTKGVITGRVKQYMKRVKQIKDSTGTEEWKRFERTSELFEKYGKQYNFDPLMLAAQGFQESQLNQDAKSHVGAIGVMQVMPATGKELKVGDIRTIEPNIHAGAKYMDQLMTRYFPDAKFDEVNRTLFAFASYNAGPGNISKMRKAAEKSGFDPDQWFNNVEIVTAQKIGIETTTYVRNIYKYYVAYKLMKEAREAGKKAREQMTPAPGK
ncbi:MAG: Lytic transglycosylase catalytic, partial [Bacteroidetes bacterium]|nr:Lytic transglycosylase catalytic [Bacteroidota bacterium]